MIICAAFSGSLRLTFVNGGCLVQPHTASNSGIEQEEPHAGNLEYSILRMAEEANVRLPPNEDRGPMLLGISWTLVAVASIIVLLRFYCRTILQNAVGWDDFAILAAVVGVSSF